MNKKYSLKQLVTTVVFAVASAVLITVMLFQIIIDNVESRNAVSGNSKNSEILELVEKYYIGDVDDKQMADSLAAGVVAGLGDKYASYVTAEDSQNRLDSLLGYNTGIGVQVSVHPDKATMIVLEVHNDGPAKESGIKAFDEITVVDDI